MKTLQGLLEELDGAAEEVYAAQTEYTKRCAAAWLAKFKLDDYEANEDGKDDVLTDYRDAMIEAACAMMEARAEYHVCVDRQRNVRVMINALTAGRE